MSFKDEKEFVIANVTPGKLNALVKNIMWNMDINDPSEAVRRINAGEWLVKKPTLFRKEKGLIRFSVTSDGTTPVEWIVRFKMMGVNVSGGALRSLYSLKPTTGITTEIVIYEDEHRIKNQIDSLDHLTTENACLIRYKFSDQDLKDMGLHKIIVKMGATKSNFLSVHSCGKGNWLDTDYFEWESFSGQGLACKVESKK